MPTRNAARSISRTREEITARDPATSLSTAARSNHGGELSPAGCRRDGLAALPAARVALDCPNGGRTGSRPRQRPRRQVPVPLDGELAHASARCHPRTRRRDRRWSGEARGSLSVVVFRRSRSGRAQPRLHPLQLRRQLDAEGHRKSHESLLRVRRETAACAWTGGSRRRDLPMSTTSRLDQYISAPRPTTISRTRNLRGSDHRSETHGPRALTRALNQARSQRKTRPRWPTLRIAVSPRPRSARESAGFDRASGAAGQGSASSKSACRCVSWFFYFYWRGNPGPSGAAAHYAAESRGRRAAAPGHGMLDAYLAPGRTRAGFSRRMLRTANSPPRDDGDFLTAAAIRGPTSRIEMLPRELRPCSAIARGALRRVSGNRIRASAPCGGRDCPARRANPPKISALAAHCRASLARYKVRRISRARSRSRQRQSQR